MTLRQGEFNYWHLINLSDSLALFISLSYLLSTGFNATNLRQLFPCFDQPEYRTTFNFTVYHTEGYTLIINADEVDTSDGPV